MNKYIDFSDFFMSNQIFIFIGITIGYLSFGKENVNELAPFMLTFIFMIINLIYTFIVERWFYKNVITNKDF